MHDGSINKLTEVVTKMEGLEKEACNLPLIFAEMLKDEINANDEYKIYNGIKRIVKKYSPDPKNISIVDELTRVMTGGASLDEIMQVAVDEAVSPSLSSSITANNKCRNS